MLRHGTFERFLPSIFWSCNSPRNTVLIKVAKMSAKKKNYGDFFFWTVLDILYTEAFKSSMILANSCAHMLN